MFEINEAWQREAPRAWQRRFPSREDIGPPAVPSRTRPECLRSIALAVSESAQALRDAPSEPGQQQAQADQGGKGDGKPHRGLGERRGGRGVIQALRPRVGGMMNTFDECG